MSIDLKGLSAPLPIEKIDFRVQSINKGGYATILAYKDARVDMERLDDVCGPLNWKREHSRDNHNCIVSIWDESKNQWVSKEDTGTESNTEKEKGLASDSFKRACFNWGIGRELYDYPIISVKLKDNEFELDNGRAKATWNLKVREWRWSAEFGDDGKIIALKAVDNDSIRFQWGKIQPPKNASAKDAAKEEYDRLPHDVRLKLHGICDECKIFHANNNVKAAFDLIESQKFTNEEKLALWYILDSKLRSALKQEEKSRK